MTIPRVSHHLSSVGRRLARMAERFDEPEVGLAKYPVIQHPWSHSVDPQMTSWRGQLYMRVGFLCFTSRL